MASAVVSNLITQWVDSTIPNKVMGSGSGGPVGTQFIQAPINLTTFRVSKAGPDERRAFLYFVLPFEDQAAITLADLEFWISESTGGAKVLSVQRVLAPWSANTLTWNNKPAVGPVVHTANIAADVVVNPILTSISLRTVLQDIANGADWYGICLTISDGDSLYGLGEHRTYSPKVNIDWVGGIARPDNLTPNGSVSKNKPVVSFEHNIMDNDLDAIQVEIDDGVDFVGAWSSGWVATAVNGKTVASLDLASTTYPGLPAGTLRYWRVRQRNLAGQVSDWSDVAEMTYVNMGTVNILQPALNSLGDPTPVVTWSYVGGGGGAQVSYQVLVHRTESGALVYDSGRIQGVETSHTITTPLQTKQSGWDGEGPPTGPGQHWPPPPPNNPTTPPNQGAPSTYFTLEIRVWDTAVRSPVIGSIAGANGDTASAGLFAFATKDFYIDLNNGLAPVTNLVAANIPPYGHAHLTWNRTEIPDEYAIYVGGHLYAIVTGISCHDGGTNFSFDIVGMPPRIEQIIFVLPRVNGKVSLGLDDPTVLFTPRLVAPVLSELDGSNPIFLLNYTLDEEEFDSHSIYDTLGSGPPIMVMQSEKGKRGALAGGLYGETMPGVTAKMESQRFDALRTGQGRPLLLRVLDYAITVYIADAQKNSRSDTTGLFYLVSFNYYQL